LQSTADQLDACTDLIRQLKQHFRSGEADNVPSETVVKKAATALMFLNNMATGECGLKSELMSKGVVGLVEQCLRLPLEQALSSASTQEVCSVLGARHSGCQQHVNVDVMDMPLQRCNHLCLLGRNGSDAWQ
jgi:hypothetical protein